MKNILSGFAAGIFIGLISFVIIYASTNEVEAERVYIPYGGSDTACVSELAATKELLLRTQDSLNSYKADTTISGELFVAKYKLERIRYYNNIAAKGNNIKYLRGWINRVLNN